MKQQTKVVRVSYSAFLCAPRPRKCEKIATQMAREGWSLVAWKEREGLFGFGAHTMLKFVRVGG